LTNEFKIEKKASDVFHPKTVDEARSSIREKRDLSGADLQGFDLHDLKATGAVLRKTNLTAANISHSLLINPNFYRTTAHGIQLQNTVLNSPDLVRADFHSANLSKSSLVAADAREAVFSAANLRHAGLVGGDYTDANFRGANLSNALLAGLKVDGADFTGADTTGTRFSGIDWSAAKVPPTILPQPIFQLPTWAWAAIVGSVIGLVGVIIYSLTRPKDQTLA
jgi:uncharacterized protein YjbI with pentapeptide repeats